MSPFAKGTALLGLFLAVLVLRAVRHSRIRVEYSLVWLLSAAMLVVCVTVPGFLSLLSSWLGLTDQPTTIVLLVSVLLLLVCFHYAILISKLREDNIALIQKVAILEFKLQSLMGGEEPK